MVVVYGENALSKSRVNEWTGRFRSGKETTPNLRRPGQSHVVITSEAIHKVDDLLRCDRCLTKDDFLFMLALVTVAFISSYTSALDVCHWVPWNLTAEQMTSA